MGEGLYGQNTELGAEAQTEFVKRLPKSMYNILFWKQIEKMVKRKRIEL